MTERDAYRILGLPPGTPPELIRTKYRQLILRIHPDTLQGLAERQLRAQDAGLPGTGRAEDAPDIGLPGTTRTKEAPDSPAPAVDADARLVNQAYAVLTRLFAARDAWDAQNAKSEQDAQDAWDQEDSPDSSNARDSAGASEGSGRWSAPQNPRAYCPRDVYCSAEDMEGTRLGTFVIARGRYLWTPEEEFSLFLQSLYHCSRRLLEQAERRAAHVPDDPDAQRRQQAQASLAYLLAQQFIDARVMLALTSTYDSASEIYTLRAALELERGARVPSGDELLYPDALRSHRLFLKNAAGRRLGYLSFPDDRLYYVVIPLFEQRRVQVRITVLPDTASSQKPRARAHRNTGSGLRSCPLEVRMRFLPEMKEHFPDSLNLRIEQILNAYVQ